MFNPFKRTLKKKITPRKKLFRLKSAIEDSIFYNKYLRPRFPESSSKWKELEKVYEDIEIIIKPSRDKENPIIPYVSKEQINALINRTRSICYQYRENGFRKFFGIRPRSAYRFDAIFDRRNNIIEESPNFLKRLFM